jgi:hypothetical protein
VNEYDWVPNPFTINAADTKHLSLKEAKELAELQADRTIQLKFRETTLLQFWTLAKKKFVSVIRRCPIYTTTLFHNLLVRAGIFQIGLH